MEIVDLAQWKRRDHFAFFQQMSCPEYNLCFDLDITPLYEHVKRCNAPMYHALIYFFVTSLNAVDEFKYRIVDGQVVRFDALHPSFTAPDADGELFKLITTELSGSFAQFAQDAARQTLEQKAFIDFTAEARHDLVYITSIPWISFTSLSHTFSLRPHDGTPKVSWGKFKRENGAVLLPFSVQANHSFVDGVHIGKYKAAIDANMDALERIFG